jgi:hypothetical protein
MMAVSLRVLLVRLFSRRHRRSNADWLFLRLLLHLDPGDIPACNKPR